MTPKFRVRDTKTGKLVDGEFFISKVGELYWWDPVKLKVEFCRRKHYKPEFSTGRQDKNGVEIFDGDKVQFKDRVTNKIEIIEIWGILHLNNIMEFNHFDSSDIEVVKDKE